MLLGVRTQYQLMPTGEIELDLLISVGIISFDIS